MRNAWLTTLGTFPATDVLVSIKRPLLRGLQHLESLKSFKSSDARRRKVIVVAVAVIGRLERKGQKKKGP